MFNFDALSQADRTWLAGRPEFSNWQAGCEKVCKHLDECTGEYVPLVFSGQPTKGVFEDCRRSIWRTWFSFWTAAVEFVQKYGQTSPRSGFRVPDDGYKVF
jgi:hypothetical protein